MVPFALTIVQRTNSWRHWCVMLEKWKWSEWRRCCVHSPAAARRLSVGFSSGIFVIVITEDTTACLRVSSYDILVTSSSAIVLAGVSDFCPRGCRAFLHSGLASFPAGTYVTYPILASWQFAWSSWASWASFFAGGHFGPWSIKWALLISCSFFSSMSWMSSISFLGASSSSVGRFCAVTSNTP